MTDSDAKLLVPGDRVRSAVTAKTGTVLAVRETPTLTVPVWVDVEWDGDDPVSRTGAMPSRNVVKL